jgi:divalent metal cation (Fe/Co/Zn/Cd) transporter
MRISRFRAWCWRAFQEILPSRAGLAQLLPPPRSKSDSAVDEKLAARVAGGLLFVVAALVIVCSGLSLVGYREPQPSFAGIILLIVAAMGMPWLASQKRKLATQVASASLRADATESALCGYLSLMALAGLLGNLIFHAPWADPIAALALVPVITREGWEAIHASRHCCN